LSRSEQTMPAKFYFRKIILSQFQSAESNGFLKEWVYIIIKNIGNTTVMQKFSDACKFKCEFLKRMKNESPHFNLVKKNPTSKIMPH
jgi:hypothetical protein